MTLKFATGNQEKKIDLFGSIMCIPLDSISKNIEIVT